MIIVLRPENSGIVLYLERRMPKAPPYAPPDGTADPYLGCGCHPDIVERLWDQIGAELPSHCRCLVYGGPALVHLESGVILGVAIGTQYALRLPGMFGAEAVKAGARTTTTWSGGDTLDVRQEFGDDWVFGAWLKEEPAWCADVCRMFDEHNG